ncbi:adenosylhomocysteinase [Acidipropionibacterium timonense]|uniref:adenosylhomocysteinase n=1 Tax=Acidipropionibacterium timonense TaxID=2161818 RepID=UPI00102F2E31|nr:adenosylhomocysteinase [Acidipropionibacterium timonense]
MTLGWADLALRRFAAATNLLVCGRTFLLPEVDSPDHRRLAGLLRGMGARVAVGATDERVQAVFLAPGEQPPRGGAVVVTHELDVLAPDGRRLVDPRDPASRAPDRLDWAREHMPVTRAAVAALGGLVAGVRVGLSLVLEPKTAVLATELADAGARVAVFAHPAETREDVAEELRRRGITVDADPRATDEAPLMGSFLGRGLEVLLDDGSHLIRAAHRIPGALDHLIGAAEETTSGLRALRGFDLRVPVVASNDARSKTLFDNAYGTGQSCLLTILDLLDRTLDGSRVVVIGYGDVGWGTARLAAGLGADVGVVEIDPVRALRAAVDGFRVGPLDELCAGADLVISATGVAGTVPASTLRALPRDAVVAVAGGGDEEVCLADALADGARWRPVSRAVDTLEWTDGHRVTILDRGQCINCTAGEGNPIEIMDLSFGVQVAALRRILLDRPGPGLCPLPKADDDAVAAAGLEAW